jgi:CheY-like chemotaxis protein
MVERHGGRISVESELGRGTTFVLSFAPSEPAKDLLSSPDVPAPRPSRVLLVEDDQHMRDLLTRMLEHDRHTVTACRSGREAISLLGTQTFDIVLTDLVMPLADGWDVAQATRKAQPMIPVVLITGTSQRFSEAELRARGVSARLNKPFRLDQLRRTIGNVLGTEEPEPSIDARPRILAVDDEPAMTRMIAAMLQTSGCEIQTANDGEDARLLLEEAARAGRPFDLLFTDMEMPDLNGGELIGQARLINPQIVTVLLSGDVGQGASVGADLNLQKPYSLAALLQTLDQATALYKRVTKR